MEVRGLAMAGATTGGVWTVWVTPGGFRTDEPARRGSVIKPPEEWRLVCKVVAPLPPASARDHPRRWSTASDGSRRVLEVQEKDEEEEEFASRCWLELPLDPPPRLFPGERCGLSA